MFPNSVMKRTPHPATANLAFVEGLYSDFLRDPTSVPREWQDYFKLFPNGELSPRFTPSFRPPSLFNPQARVAAAPALDGAEAAALQERLNQLIRSYRVHGHIIARLDPLGMPRRSPQELDPAFWGFKESDMDRRIATKAFPCDGPLTFREVLEKLRSTYCQSIGVQYMHIDDLSIRRWMQQRMEPVANRLRLARAEQLRILTRLTDAVAFEEFIRKKFIGAKSFSLEGSESLIPLLDLAIEKAASQDVREIVFGMAHRGRLNVLANIIGKSPRAIFREFADKDPELYVGRGDVKYHLGYSADWQTGSGKKVHLSLCFNPSHLEFVNPVALGRARAKQDRDNDTERTRTMALLIHGDAAFAGEGITQETLNLCNLAGYSVGGALHVVINNQIGFTTGPEQGRSTQYCTDVAKMLQSPIFHVNGEDPEAVAQVVQLAMEFRAAFKRDVFIDMYGYRRLGHNEGDEPSFTQPLLYRAIHERKPVREGYLDHLLKLGEITREEADQIAAQRREHLERELSAAHSAEYKHPGEALHGVWRGFHGGEQPDKVEPKTGVEKERLAALLQKQTELPKDFHPHPKIERLLESRREMAQGKIPLDWSAAEALAFAVTASEGRRIRLSGQDSARGTFSHRHAVLHDHEDGHTFTPLQNIEVMAESSNGSTRNTQHATRIEFINSPLSEAGVLGFDYGYSLDCPAGLILWEAQYGDFANSAQVIIDQFISSAEDKWRRLSGLVLLLPHGFEGSGPEHSSARLERFLTLVAEHNMQVVYPTTAAQYYHLLRRQVLRRWRKPLVVMTPKSLLRDPRVASSLEELSSGAFQSIIPDPLPPENTKRVLLCSGKVYYDLEKQRRESKRDDAAIIRFEQLYPLAQEEMVSTLKNYRDGTPVCWVQEEPENMGAWRYINAEFGELIRKRFSFKAVCRPASASPATGSAHAHRLEQAQLLAEALG